MNSEIFCGSMRERIKASKNLSWLLRHGAEKAGIKLDKNGWANLDSILALPSFKSVTKETIYEIVKECPKQRFSLKEDKENIYIKAHQGHSIKNLDLELIPVEPLDLDKPFIYHGTYYKAWSSIKSMGLSRMKRVHIHFSPSFPKPKDVCCGIRESCELIIEVDVNKLHAAGFKLWKSENNVILCEGNEKGLIPPVYFSKVIDRKTGRDLYRVKTDKMRTLS